MLEETNMHKFSVLPEILKVNSSLSELRCPYVQIQVDISGNFVICISICKPGVSSAVPVHSKCILTQQTFYSGFEKSAEVFP